MTHSSPANASREAILEKAIRAVIDASGAYLPPDGISKDEFINRVLGATDNTEVFHALNIRAQPAASPENAVLLPCPFCGGKPFLHGPDNPGHEYWVSCQSCQASSLMRSNFDATKAAWNARPVIHAQQMPDRQAIARAIYGVATDWLKRGGIGIPLASFDEISERDRNLHLAYADAVLALTSPEPHTPHDPTRCKICDWPLAESREFGCVPGDCSYRPDTPAEQERIRKRRATLTDRGQP